MVLVLGGGGGVAVKARLRTKVFSMRVTFDKYDDHQAIRVLEGVSNGRLAAVVREMIRYAVAQGVDVSHVAPAKKRKIMRGRPAAPPATGKGR